MYISEPVTLTEKYIDNSSEGNKLKLMLDANFQDYMDSVKQGGQLEIKSGNLRNKVSAIISGIGLAAGTFGGPGGMAAGFAIGNTIGKYIGNSLSQRVYGKAIADMSDIYHQARVRHSQIATSIALQDKMGEGIDALRQNENKRLKEAYQAMSA